MNVLTKTRNEPKRSKTSQNEPKRPKTSQNKPRKCGMTQKDPEFQNWGNLECSTSFRFSNFWPKCPNLGLFGSRSINFLIF